MVEVSEIWRELVIGSCRVVDSFFSETRCYLMLGQVRYAGAATSVTGRRLQIVQAVLASSSQKSIAIDLALAPSTVALHSRLALRDIGVEAKPSRAHPLLMLAAACGSSPGTKARCAVFASRDQRQLRVLSAPRPEQLLLDRLPTAELSVVQRLIEGWSHVEIARERKTSPRTVANQISAVFRRLHVSGRNELVQSLFTDEYRNLAGQIPIGETPGAVPNEQTALAIGPALRSA
jgi:DNA-binding NarL/FixJ family response regulator